MEGLAQGWSLHADGVENRILSKTLAQEDALAAVSKGNARLYFTPNDVNLSIETHDHADDRHVLVN